jgi:hypothetical protein
MADALDTGPFASTFLPRQVAVGGVSGCRRGVLMYAGQAPMPSLSALGVPFRVGQLLLAAIKRLHSGGDDEDR